MCYNLAYLERRAQKLAERYKEVLQKPDSVPPFIDKLPSFYFISGFVHPHLPVITYEGLRIYEWGLVPFWVKDIAGAKEIQSKTLNAVGETVFDKPSFRSSIIRKRCLLPVSGFYEWRDADKKKYPYYIQLRNEEIFSLGGIYENWVDKNTGEIKYTFSILTTPANPLMARIHNLKKRMPLIVSRADERNWIDPSLTKEQITGLIKPFPEEEMTAYTISQAANNPRNHRNVPEILERVEYAGLE